MGAPSEGTAPSVAERAGPRSVLRRLARLTKRAYREYRAGGFRYALGVARASALYAASKLLAPPFDMSAHLPEVDAYDPERPRPETDFSDEPVLNWVIPTMGIGSGGHLSIFRFIQFLERRGYRNRVYLHGDRKFSNDASFKQFVDAHFFRLNAECVIDRGSPLKPARATFATSWETAYVVWHRGTGKRLYFVQDFEPLFYPASAEAAFAEETYRFGFPAVTAGTWLAEKLSTTYGMKTAAFRFSAAPSFVPKARGSGPPTVFYYARPPTPRRGFALGIKALARVQKMLPKVEIVLAGQPLDRGSLPLQFRDYGVLPFADLPAFLARADVSLILSFTNCSLLPLEAMACGSVVVTNEGPNNAWLLGDAVVYTKPAVAGVARTIVELLQTPEKLARYRERALTFPKSTWEEEYEKLTPFLRPYLGA